MPVNLYEAVWIFLIYAFLGWVSEVAFAAVNQGKFVNRGFLNGPVCPIYGFGMLAVVVVLWPLRKNVLLLFLGAAVLTTALEFITGLVLEKFFHDKWWDYSNMPFNIKGYVCLKFSILWGLAAAFIIGGVHPFIYLIISKTPIVLGSVLLAVFAVIFVADFVITLIELLKLPKKLNAMLEVEKMLNSLSDKIGENVSDKAITAREKGEEFVDGKKPKLDELKAEYDAKAAEYKRIMSENIVHKRIFKAFPRLKNGRYKNLFERIAVLKKTDKDGKQNGGD